MIDFQDFQLPESPNYYYVAPRSWSEPKPNSHSPIFDIQLEVLKKAWLKVIDQQPRVTVVQQKEHQFAYIQRTKWLRFPDYVDVVLIAHSPNQSSIAIYSRSKYGYYDFGVNQKRVQAWLEALKKEVGEGK